MQTAPHRHQVQNECFEEVEKAAVPARLVFNATRAVTIDARPEQIWPWLVQMGDQRAGFYGYDWFDNDGMPSADRIIPALQHLKVGDEIRIGLGTFKVVAVEPNHSLVWASPNGGYSMALALYPLDASHTRLV